MKDINIYQVYRDFSDFSGQDYEEYGYYRNLDNAISKFKEVVYHHEGKNVEVDLDELNKQGCFTFKEWIGIYGIAKIETED